MTCPCILRKLSAKTGFYYEDRFPVLDRWVTAGRPLPSSRVLVLFIISPEAASVASWTYASERRTGYLHCILWNQLPGPARQRLTVPDHFHIHLLIYIDLGNGRHAKQG